MFHSKFHLKKITMNPYIPLINRSIPRILTNLDRDKTSETYGCFDRNYWHYRMRDFPSMVLQQPVLALARLYTNNYEGSPYYQNEKVKEWIIAAVEFWKKRQHSDGSFDEYYPHEHSFPPTVFSLHAVSESCRMLSYMTPELEEAILRSAGFVSRWDEAGAVNQDVASIPALYSCFLLLKKPWLLEAARQKLEKMKRLQNEEGWLPEYGGADIGYLSVSLNYLCEYLQISGDKSVLENIKAMIGFIKYFVHPDGTAGGEYCSRDTEYMLPNGLEIAAQEFPAARRIADVFSNPSLDDRYLCHYFSHSIAGALLNYREGEAEALPAESNAPFEKHFPKAGLLIKNTDSYFAILGLSKGGSLKLFSDKRLLLNDFGYSAKGGGNQYATNWVGGYQSKVQGSSLMITGTMKYSKRMVSSPVKHVALRASSGVFRGRLIPRLKKRMIMPKESDVRFSRAIELGSDHILIKDNIQSRKPLDVQTAEAFSPRFVPSSKFFRPQQMPEMSFDKAFKDVKKLEVTKRIDVKGKRIEFSSDY